MIQSDALPHCQSADSLLLVIDVQNSFMPGGELPVAEGDTIVPLINQLATHFNHVAITQDWHPADHCSFASNHDNRQNFETFQMPYGLQCLWPAHCIQGTRGAELHPDLQLPMASLILRKGWHQHLDSYSAFLEADGQTSTGLAACLHARGIRSIFMVGLATDFCVAYSAIDGRKAGFDVWVIEDACRAIDINDSLIQARQRMAEQGVNFIHAQQILTSPTLGGPLCGKLNITNGQC